jgi:uncharacterized protein YaeQ
VIVSDVIDLWIRVTSALDERVTRVSNQFALIDLRCYSSRSKLKHPR